MTTRRAPSSRRLGVASAILSALLFGISPVFVKMAYLGGSNGVMMVFTRSLFASPILFALAKKRKVSLKLDQFEWPVLLIVCIFGNFATTLALYSSYSFIDVGMATVLHYIFPVIVMLASVLFFKEHIMWWKTLALVMGCLGVASFIGGVSDRTEWRGIALALSSGFTYAGMIVSVERTILKSFHYIKLTFYSNFVIIFTSLLTALSSGKLNFQMSFLAWTYSVLVALLTGVGAFSLLNISIVLCGASTTSIIAMLEPLSGLIFGYLLLNEALSKRNIAGCCFILLGVLVVSICTALEPPGIKESTTKE